MKAWIVAVSVGAYVMRWISAFDGSSEIEQKSWYIVAMVFLAALMVVHALEKRGD